MMDKCGLCGKVLFPWSSILIYGGGKVGHRVCAVSYEEGHKEGFDLGTSLSD